MKHTKYKISIVTLALALALSLAALFGIHFYPANAASTVTVSGTNIFTATGDALVIADKQGGDDDAKYYSMFVFAFNDDVISYRRNLAYHWYEDGKEGLFNMEIGFKTTAFDRFVIKFESAEYNKSEDGKASNYVVFFPVSDQENKVYAVITNDGDVELDGSGQYTALDADNITIRFTEKLAGGYAVSVSNDGENLVEGTFENVSGNFAKASTTTSSPLYPLIFKAEFENEEDDDRDSAQMVLYSLNGQSFEVSGATYSETNDYWSGGTVNDDTPPVLCLSEDLNYFEVGGELDFDYTVVDVLQSSPKATVSYYILTVDQYNDKDASLTSDSLFTEISASETYLLVSGSDKYMPSKEVADSSVYGENFSVDMAVKVRLKLTDKTTNGESDEVYLDWYVSDVYKLAINGSSFIAVAKDEIGATYNYDGVDGKSWEEIKAEYQAQVDELAKNLSAGSSSYLYLPSAEYLFSDNATSYTDLTLGIYYYSNSQQSNTGLTSSKLSINITQQGAYTFTIYATDAAGNNMYYLDEDGEMVEFAASEIWTMYEDEDEEGLADKLPWFTFSVGYTGVKFSETPGLQATAYVGTSYSSASFKINGISGSYDTVYRLFLFDRAAYYNDKNITLTYEEYVNRLDELFSNGETRIYFKEIPALSDLEETDEDYEQYSAYAWSKTSTTFTPQDDNAFYLIRAEVTDKQYISDPIVCNLGVVASVKAETLKGESDWLKNNVASVVLLCVAGVALIGIILLIIIKPKDKGDIDEQFEKDKKAAKKSKK